MPELGDVGLLHPAVRQVSLQPDLAKQHIVVVVVNHVTIVAMDMGC